MMVRKITTAIGASKLTIQENKLINNQLSHKAAVATQPAKGKKRRLKPLIEDLRNNNSEILPSPSQDLFKSTSKRQTTDEMEKAKKSIH